MVSIKNDPKRNLDGNRRLYGGICLVVQYFEILKLVIKYRRRLLLYIQCWQRIGLPGELQGRLLQMIRVNVNITSRPDKIPRKQVTLLREHVSHQRVGRYIKWHAQKVVSTALIQLAG